MINRPIIQPHIRPVVVAGTGVLMLSEAKQRLVRGGLYERLAPLIDGSRTADEIVDLLDPEWPAAQVYYALMMLEQRGYLRERDGHARNDSGYWDLCGFGVERVTQQLASKSVSIVTFGQHVDAEEVAGLLAEMGVRCGGEQGDLTVVLADDYLAEGLEEFNAAAVEERRPWMLAKPLGASPWTGPLFLHPETPCWACLAQRHREHRDLDMFLGENGNRNAVLPPCDTPLLRGISYRVLAMEVVRALVSDTTQSALRGKILSIDSRSWQSETHDLVRRPQCPVCGEQRYRTRLQPAPIELSSQRAQFTTDGGYRSVSPQETIARFGHHVSPVSGAVRVLQRHELATNDMCAYVAGNNLSARGRPDAPKTLRNYSGGKGVTDAQAKASALCEALERYSGVHQGYEPGVHASFKDLGDVAIPPNDCMLYSDQQFRGRVEINKKRSRYYWVPEPFDETARISWTPVWSLSRMAFRYLPTSYCYYGFCDQDGKGGELRFCHACSNGNAAGNTLEEAILQGLLELVERDSVALWWYNCLRRPALDLSTFAEPYLENMQGQYAEHGRVLWVLDLTSDLGIPAFAAISSGHDGRGPLLLGFGCHVDARLAVLRAVTEMNQLFLAALSLAATAEGSVSGVDPETADWLSNAALADHPYLVPDPHAPARKASEFAHASSDDLREQVRSCQNVLERHGLEVLVLDQTRPDIGLAVAKVIVPGLRHFWPRLAPGRLYDAPVSMGWLSAPRAEQDLNRVPIFF